MTETVVPDQTQVEIGLWSRINSELASTLVVQRAAQLCCSETGREWRLERGRIHGGNGGLTSSGDLLPPKKLSEQ